MWPSERTRRADTYHEIAGEQPCQQVSVELECVEERGGNHAHVSQRLSIGNVLWVRGNLGWHLGKPVERSLGGQAIKGHARA